VSSVEVGVAVPAFAVALTATAGGKRRRLFHERWLERSASVPTTWPSSAQLSALLGGQVDAEAAADGLAYTGQAPGTTLLPSGREHGEALPPVDLAGLALCRPGCGQFVHDPG
jgi:hypothetical protein